MAVWLLKVCKLSEQANPFPHMLQSTDLLGEKLHGQVEIREHALDYAIRCACHRRAGVHTGR